MYLHHSELSPDSSFQLLFRPDTSDETLDAWNDRGIVSAPSTFQAGAERDKVDNDARKVDNSDHGRAL